MLRDREFLTHRRLLPKFVLFAAVFCRRAAINRNSIGNRGIFNYARLLNAALRA